MNDDVMFPPSLERHKTKEFVSVPIAEPFTACNITCERPLKYFKLSDVR